MNSGNSGVAKFRLLLEIWPPVLTCSNPALISMEPAFPIKSVDVEMSPPFWIFTFGEETVIIPASPKEKSSLLLVKLLCEMVRPSVALMVILPAVPELSLAAVVTPLLSKSSCPAVMEIFPADPSKLKGKLSLSPTVSLRMRLSVRATLCAVLSGPVSP